jgi:cytochrome P450
VKSGSVGNSVSEDELVGMLTHVLFAGHETTTNLIANGIRQLLLHPNELLRLRTEPILASTAPDELLRFDGPAKLVVRWASDDFVVGGSRISKRERVFLVVASANRDAAKFTEPDRLDIARSPNPHLGLGFGPHFCLGAPLARLEGEIAILSLVQRLPELKLLDKPLDWQPQIVNRGLGELWVAY